MKCRVIACKKQATQHHHILYKKHFKGPLVGELCEEHHDWITRKQSHVARRQHSELSTKQRWFFWFELIQGRMKKPRKTHLDEKWKRSYKK
jgi:hypothetical protein